MDTTFKSVSHIATNGKPGQNGLGYITPALDVPVIFTPEEENAFAVLNPKFPTVAEVYRAEYARRHSGVDGEDFPALDPERFKMRTAAEALAPRTPKTWVVDHLLAAGSVNIFYGEGGSKKTYSLIDCAVCVATGTPWLDRKVTPSPVLIVDEENGPDRMAERLSMVLRGHYADEATPVKYITLAQFDLRQPADVNALQLLIQQAGARLVIIDSLVDVMPGADENSVKDVQPVFLSLRKVAETTGCAVVLIHHANKSGGYRGSTALKGAVDLLLSVESKEDSPNIDFRTEKARDTEPQLFSAIAHFRPDQMWLTASDTKAKPPQFSKSERYVLRYLEDNATAEMSAIMAAADVCSDQAARQAVYSLTDKGYVRRVDAGGPGTKGTYGLTEKGKLA